MAEASHRRACALGCQAAAGPAVVVSAAVAAQFGDGLAVPLFSEAAAGHRQPAVHRGSGTPARGRKALAAGAGTPGMAGHHRPGLRGGRDELELLRGGRQAAVGHRGHDRVPRPVRDHRGGRLDQPQWHRAAVRGGCRCGVGAVSAASLHVSPSGLGFALVAAACLAGYVLLGGWLAQASGRPDFLALATAVAAAVTLPLLRPAVTQLGPGPAARGMLSGWLGIAVVYALERQALRLTSAKTVSVLLSWPGGGRAGRLRRSASASPPKCWPEWPACSAQSRSSPPAPASTRPRPRPGGAPVAIRAGESGAAPALGRPDPWRVAARPRSGCPGC